MSNGKKKDWRDIVDIKKRREPLVYNGIEFVFPNWNLLPQLNGGRGDLISQEFRKSLETWDVLEPITVNLPDEQHGSRKVAIKDERLVWEDDGDVIDMIPDQLAAANDKPVVEIVHGEVRLRAAYAAGLPLSKVRFRERRDFTKEQLDKIDESFKSHLRNQDEKDRYDNFPEELKTALRSFHELWERDIRSKNGLDKAARTQFVSLIDRKWKQLGFDVMPQRKLGNIMHVAPRTIGRDRDEILAEISPDVDSVLKRIGKLERKKDKVDGVLVMLDDFRFEMGDGDYEDAANGLKSFKTVLSGHRNDLIDQKNQYADAIYERMADGTENFFEVLFGHKKAEEKAGETNVEKLLGAQEPTNVTNPIDEKWEDDVDDALGQAGDSDE